MKISLNPKPHLKKHRLRLVWALPCQQCSMGNEEWVGVCVWPCRPINNSLRGPPRTINNLCARTVNMSCALSSSSIDRPHFHMYRRKTNCFTVVLQDVCELGEVERKLHRRWSLCFLKAQQFTHLLCLLSLLHYSLVREREGGRTWAYGLFGILYLILWWMWLMLSNPARRYTWELMFITGVCICCPHIIQIAS